MARRAPTDAASRDDCAIAAALGVVGDGWSLLILRDVAGGVHRFDALQAELAISRKVLTERLRDLMADGVLERRPYLEHPPRFEYHLTERGRDLLPVLVALQTWGAQHLLGDGRLTATSSVRSREARRARALLGSTVPEVTLTAADDTSHDVLAADGWTVLCGFPGAHAPGDHGYPPGWADIPGAAGCTLEARTLRDLYAEFRGRGAEVHAVSTQHPEQLAAFAAHEQIPYPMLSDAGLELAAALRLPTFSAGGQQRLKRITLLVDPERIVRRVIYPVTDPAGSVSVALDALDTLGSRVAVG